MTVSAPPTPSHRMRRWAYAPLIATLTAGAVASGIAIGAADTTTSSTGPDTVAGAESSLTGSQYAWRVHNFTDQTLTAGDFQRDEGHGLYSALAFGGTTPWAALEPGKTTAAAFQPYEPLSDIHTHTVGKVCYLGRIWNLPYSDTPFSMFSSKWQDMYVFAMDTPTGGKKLMITPDGGHDDIDMTTSGETC